MCRMLYVVLPRTPAALGHGTEIFDKTELYQMLNIFLAMGNKSSTQELVFFLPNYKEWAPWSFLKAIKIYSFFSGAVLAENTLKSSTT